MALWDTFNTFVNGVGTLNSAYNNLYNAFGGGQQGGLLNLGGSIYNNYQNRDAINQAVNAVRDYGTQSQNVLTNVYNQGMQAATPYTQAGTNALTGYQNLLQNPSQITNDPGYQFQRDQGEQALTRSNAANRMLGSGNFAQELSRYNQDYASNAYNMALNRYTPLIDAGRAGLGATADLGRNYSYGITGINSSIADAIAGGALGRAGSTTGLLSDILGQPNSQQNVQQGGAGLNLPSNPTSGLNGLSQLTNAGNGNPFAAIGESINQTGQGTWGDLTTGPRTFQQSQQYLNGLNTGGSVAGGLSGLGAAFGSSPAFGTLPASLTANAGGATATLGSQFGFAPQFGSLPASAVGSGATAGAAGGSAAGGTAAGGGAAGAGGMSLAAGAGIAAMVIGLGKLTHAISSGGQNDKHKVTKYTQELQNRYNADPSGRSATQFMADIAENRQWPNENNGWVIGDAIERGIITTDFPNLHSSQSAIDLWAIGPEHILDPGLAKSTVTAGGNTADGGGYWSGGRQNAKAYQLTNTASIGPAALAQTYGLNQQQQEQYANLVEQYQSASGSMLKGGDENGIMVRVPDYRGEDTVIHVGSVKDIPPGGSVLVDAPQGDNKQWVPIEQTQFAKSRAAVEQFQNTYMTEPRRKLYAQGMYESLRSQGYQGDLSKLEAYIRG